MAGHSRHCVVVSPAARAERHPVAPGAQPHLAVAAPRRPDAAGARPRRPQGGQRVRRLLRHPARPTQAAVGADRRCKGGAAQQGPARWRHRSPTRPPAAASEIYNHCKRVGTNHTH